MKLKHILTLLGVSFSLAAVGAVGVAAGEKWAEKDENLVAEVNATGSITVYVTGLSEYSMSGSPMHLSLNNSSWYDASWTSGAEWNNIGQFKHVFSADSSSSLYCYFTEYENDITTYWHPTGGTEWDTNYSSLGSVSLTAGKSYLITVTGFSYGWANPDNGYTHKWFNFTVTEYVAPDTCLVKGTWDEGGLVDDNTGVSVGAYSNGQFEIINLHLITTDSIYFAVEGWFDNAGYSLISGDGTSLFDSSKANLVPNENGYYNFYIQKTVMYVTKTEAEDVDDGLYLRHSTDDMATNLIQLTKISSTVYTLNNYSMAAGVSYKAVKYVDGLMSWCEINTVTAGDSNYFPVAAAGGNARVTNAGKYNLTVTLVGTSWNYSFVDSASAWCRDFLDSMTCTSSGTVAPVFKTGYSWTSSTASYTTTYNALDDIAKDAIYGATANPSGSVIQEAASRYDTIVHNHGYLKFIVNSSEEARGIYNVPSVVSTENSNASMFTIVLLVSTISAIAVGGVVIIRKRKQEN